MSQARTQIRCTRRSECDFAYYVECAWRCACETSNDSKKAPARTQTRRITSKTLSYLINYTLSKGNVYTKKACDDNAERRWNMPFARRTKTTPTNGHNYDTQTGSVHILICTYGAVDNIQMTWAIIIGARKSVSVLTFSGNHFILPAHISRAHQTTTANRINHPLNMHESDKKLANDSFFSWSDHSCSSYFPV